MEHFKLIYKNFFGKFNIIVTKTVNKKNPVDTFIPDRELFNAHIWVKDNVVVKNNSNFQDVFSLDKTISDDDLKILLSNSESLMTDKELASFAYDKIYHEENIDSKLRKVFRDSTEDAYFSGFLNLFKKLKKTNKS